MGYIKIITLSLSILLTASCTNMGPQYTKIDYVAANKFCADQSNVDKKAMNRQWFTRWMTCAQERIMPIEIYYYPAKDGDIRKMYGKLLVLAEDVDSGKSRVEPVYAEWDRMMSEIKMASCKLKVVGRDGSEECLAR